MIRRTFKARVSRSSNLNRSYKVWWSYGFTPIKCYTKPFQTLLDQIQWVGEKHNNQRNLTSKFIEVRGIPRQLSLATKGHQPLFPRISVFENTYNIKTKEQTETRYINCLEIGALKITPQLYKVRKWLIPTNTFTNYQSLNHLLYLYEKPFWGNAYRQNHRKQFFNRVYKRFERFFFKKQGAYNNKTRYSYRERFARTLLNRNRYYEKHSHISYHNNRIKL